MVVLEKPGNNRQTPRLETRGSLTYFPFSSRKVPSRTAHILDCSPGGMSFIANRALKPGQTICLHLQTIAPRAGAMLKSFALAEVRWCAPAAWNQECYHIGVRYFQPLEPSDPPFPV